MAGGAYLVLMAFSGLSAGIVARSRGNSFWLWFFLGLCMIIPFLGTVLAYLYRRGDEDEYHECPECGGLNPLWAQTCGRCGRDLDFPEDAVAEREPTGA